MFRYLALAWDPDTPAAAASAAALRESLRAQPGWQQMLAHPQLAVFCTGMRPGVNEACLLPGSSGIVLGRLFRRHGSQNRTDAVAQLLARSDDITATGGRALVERFWGRYVAFFESGGRVHVLRDPSGTLPCLQLRHQGVTLVFSWLDDVLDLLPQIPTPSVSHMGLAAYMAFGELTGRQTALEGVRQVLAGERTALTGNGRDHSCLLWSAAEVANRPADMGAAEAMTTLRECVERCARAWAGCYGSILLRLSGGVDSSILAACLAADKVPSRLTCLNYHSIGADSDERPYARMAAASAGHELIEYARDPSFRLERMLDVARTPVPNNYVGRLTSSSDAEVAEHVCAPAMFTGAGGDQLFFEVRQWWPAADYLRLRGLDGGFAAAALDAARLGKVSVWKAVRLALTDRFRDRPPALHTLIRRTLIAEPVKRIADQPQDHVHPAFLEPTRLPIGKLTQVQQLAYPAGYYDPYARERAPELVNPLLSQPLVELCLRLPTYLLTHGGRGRALARKAFADAIPRAIATRRSKGGMEEHIKAVLAANLDFARQMLLDGELRRLGLLDRAAVEAAFAGRQAGTGTPVGEIHFCIGVEAWLRRWSTRPRQPAA